ncbi:hypothetical protein BDN70DRAFT_873819 [Pholiota conissans]|uniref:Uncharacterized protein n=1 Tax=Pholiota conissans TaxID=109636 RepID=A0A9P5ZCN4_9AGAR|nr:hypothetical protein BDN70DRAFT_873819 [Pholiota conissans]
MLLLPTLALTTRNSSGDVHAVLFLPIVTVAERDALDRGIWTRTTVPSILICYELTHDVLANVQPANINILRLSSEGMLTESRTGPLDVDLTI